VATRLLHDLVNDEPRVASYDESLDPKLDRDVRLLTRASYSATLFEAGKWSRMAYCILTPRGEMKTRPASTPVFIRDPSKYKVQH
jgi:hypothetical protein